METDKILEKFTRQMRIEMSFPDMEKEVSARVVRFSRPAPGMSQILYARLDEDTADAEIQSQIDSFTGRELPFSWKAYGYDTPSDLVERLARHGFTPDPPDDVMVLDMVDTPSTLLAPPAGDVRQIEARHLGDVVQVLENVWGGNFNWVYQRLGAHLAVPDYLSIFAAYIDGQPGCAGWIYYHPGSEFASLWGGSTVPTMRNKGLYTAILAARIQEARNRGIRYLVTDASPMSRPTLGKFGFFQLTTVVQCEYTGP